MNTNKQKYEYFPGTIVLPSDTYDTKNHQLIGRRVAGKQFLEGITSNLKDEEIINIIVYSEKEVHELKNILEKAGINLNRINFNIGLENINLNKIENIHIAGPDLDQWSIIRSGFRRNLFSITGVIHTLSSTAVIKSIKDYLTGGLESWDSLVCTSTSGKKVVEKIIDFHHQELESKYETKLSKKKYPKITTIPLAVNDITYQRNLTREEKRSISRIKLEIPKDSLVILSLGRLSFNSKYHPLPLYRSIAKLAAKRPNLNVILLECGSFYNDNIKTNYDNLIKSIKPLKVIRLGGIKPATEKEKIDALNASDIFLSPSDNIQETFGISVIEAMAASLPCIVSDWNGYKDHVKNNENGFRISTTQLNNLENKIDNIDIDYRIGKISYDYMIGIKSMYTVVDEDEMIIKLIELADNPHLRERMGINSRKRWQNYYSWQVVSNKYRELWEELKIIRSTSSIMQQKSNSYPSIKYLFNNYSVNNPIRYKLVRTKDCCPPEILNYPLHRVFTRKILGDKYQQLINFLNTNNTISSEDIINLKIENQKCQEVMALLEKLGIAQKES